MGSGFYPEVERLLRANGCFFVRQGKGSHEIWQCASTGKRFSVSVTVGKKTTANAILKLAGISQKI